MLTFISTGRRAGEAILKKEHYDIVNTHFVLPTGPVGDAIARAAGIPNVLTLHGGDLYDPSKFTSPHRHLLFRAWIRRLLRRSHIVVGQSKNTLENMRRFYTPEIEGIRIPLGIQRPERDAGSRQGYGLRDDEVLLATVGRLVARKAIDQLIAVIDVLRAERVRLLIVGSGPQGQALKRETLNGPVEDRVLRLGHVEEADKFRALRMCDFYVSTSQHEGFGLVFLEAMACGLPIVCYDHGGQTDFLESSTTGFLVPLNDMQSFAESCRRLIR